MIIMLGKKHNYFDNQLNKHPMMINRIFLKYMQLLLKNIRIKKIIFYFLLLIYMRVSDFIQKVISVHFASLTKASTCSSILSSRLG
jgi:hypothetical protein